MLLDRLSCLQIQLLIFSSMTRHDHSRPGWVHWLRCVYVYKDDQFACYVPPVDLLFPCEAAKLPCGHVVQQLGPTVRQSRWAAAAFCDWCEAVKPQHSRVRNCVRGGTLTGRQLDLLLVIRNRITVWQHLVRLSRESPDTLTQLTVGCVVFELLWRGLKFLDWYRVKLQQSGGSRTHRKQRGETDPPEIMETSGLQARLWQVRTEKSFNCFNTLFSVIIPRLWRKYAITST